MVIKECGEHYLALEQVVAKVYVNAVSVGIKQDASWLRKYTLLMIIFTSVCSV